MLVVNKVAISLFPAQNLLLILQVPISLLTPPTDLPAAARILCDVSVDHGDDEDFSC